FRYPARPDALVFRSFKLKVDAGTTVALVRLAIEPVPCSFRWE
ncbi:unnamed protein product, partial [Ectocarpus sp. 8 AP-2014]